MHKVTKGMWKQFNRQQSAYLQLRAELTKTVRELEKVAERLDLLRRLLALEGKEVELPPKLASRAANRRRAA